MSDPYEVLGVAPQATEAQIRQRYLQLVRDHPPEREPERFAAIRHAYDQLRDPVAGMERRLLDLKNVETFESILADAQKQLADRRIPTEVLLSLGER